MLLSQHVHQHCLVVDIPFAIHGAAVNRIVLVDHVDGLPLERELEMNGTTAIVRWEWCRAWLLWFFLTVIAVHFFLFLDVVLPVAVL